MEKPLASTYRLASKSWGDYWNSFIALMMVCATPARRGMPTKLQARTSLMAGVSDVVAFAFDGCMMSYTPGGKPDAAVSASTCAALFFSFIAASFCVM